jgi:DNA-binding IclR family transcriptional regulator
LCFEKQDAVTKPDLVEPAGAKPYAAPALDKGLDILELLCSLEQPLNQREIAKRLDRSVGEIYRMLACLVDRQYVSLIDDNYYLTMKLFELANRNPPTQRLLVEARPIMQYLATTLDQSCHLTVYGQGKQVVIAKVDMPTAMGFSVRVGAELDLVVSASGRVLVAFQDKGTQALRLEEAGRRAPGLNYPDLAATLKAIHERGYESAPGVQLKGLHAISYPVLDTQGHAIAAITVPYAERIDQRNHTSIPQVEQALGKAARQLSALIGGKVQG